MSKKCLKCGKEFNNREIINGVAKNLQNRKYCLDCSPWGKHNTKDLIIKEKEEKSGMRKCSHCKEEFPNNDKYFYYKSKKRDRLSNCCKKCFNEDMMKRMDGFKEKCFEYKKIYCCEKCGYDRNKAALVFHHLDPFEKEFNIGKAYNRNWESVKKEIDKCIILCHNCHTETHFPFHNKKDS